MPRSPGVDRRETTTARMERAMHRLAVATFGFANCWRRARRVHGGRSDQGTAADLHRLIRSPYSKGDADDDPCLPYGSHAPSRISVQVQVKPSLAAVGRDGAGDAADDREQLLARGRRGRQVDHEP